MLNRWAPWYTTATETLPYADTVTYQLGADWLLGLSVEDRGCGYGWFKKLHKGDYQGVDGTAIFGAKEADLRTYRNPVEGIYMRHVLEHNYQWEPILTNALQDFTKRMALVLFTPMSSGEGVKEVTFFEPIGVPDLSMDEQMLSQMFAEHGVSSSYQDLQTSAAYGVERIYFLSKE